MNKKNNAKKSGAGFVIGIIVFLLCAGSVGFLVYYQNNKERMEQAIAISQYGPRKGVPREIDDLKKAIATYEKQLDLYVKDAAQTSVYWKILGTRFADKGMHKEALNAYQHALDYKVEEAVLYYLTGISAGKAGKYALDFDKDENTAAHYFSLAEKAYINAIELQDNYSQALYALAVLYAFELNMPQLAIPRIERYMEFRSGDIDAYFILARCYYMLGDYRNALLQYDIIISSAKDPAKKREAENNTLLIRGLLNG